MLDAFLDPATCSLKVCGVTTADDAENLARLGVPALGANFWPGSKRHLPVERAAFLEPLAGRILRVGVFVNAGPDLPRQLFERGWIDAVQLHGDESPEEAARLADAGLPILKALGIRGPDDLAKAADFPARGLLLDAHAPGLYGGTGQTIDWDAAADFVHRHPDRPIILAGGIVPDNAAEAIEVVRPAAIDVASGAETSPGLKDFNKVAALLDATRGACT